LLKEEKIYKESQQIIINGKKEVEIAEKNKKDILEEKAKLEIEGKLLEGYRK